jgi:hypothetical protein
VVFCVKSCATPPSSMVSKAHIQPTFSDETHSLQLLIAIFPHELCRVGLRKFCSFLPSYSCMYFFFAACSSLLMFSASDFLWQPTSAISMVLLSSSPRSISSTVSHPFQQGTFDVQWCALCESLVMRRSE